MDDLCSWDWLGTKIYVEHCDNEKNTLNSLSKAEIEYIGIKILSLPLKTLILKKELVLIWML